MKIAALSIDSHLLHNVYTNVSEIMSLGSDDNVPPWSDGGQGN